jgi:hypothetical protein
MSTGKIADVEGRKIFIFSDLNSCAFARYMQMKPHGVVMKRIRILGFLLLGISLQAQAANPCCTVTAIDARTGVVMAKDNASARAFQFKAPNVSLLRELRIGAPVYANFSAKQVSLDGRSACCAIIDAGAPAASASALAASPPATPVPAATSPNLAASAPASTAPVAVRAGGALETPATTAERTAAKVPQQSVKSAESAALAGALGLPQVSYGTPQMQDAATPGAPLMRGKSKPTSVNSNLVHLRGIDGIKQATNVPEEVKDFLVMHAMNLPPDQIDHYIVNVQLAAEWVKTHPEPASAKGAASRGDGHTGCHSLSINCAEQAGEHAVDEASRQSAALLKQAQQDWQKVSADATHAWGQLLNCMADNTLTLPNIPVKFAISPTMPVLAFDKKGSTKNDNGSASGEVSGSVTVGIPVTADFTTQVDMFYIPCLPFVIRPKDIGGNGDLTVGSKLTVSVNAKGQFDQSFTVPPGGGLKIPVEVIPIVILGVPVAEMDVSVYMDGTLDVNGQGTLNGNVTLLAQHKTGFDFQCDGKDCQLHDHGIPVPDTSAESVQLNGRIHVVPAVYAALQLDFEVDALSVRAGPQPYLTGEIAGCYSASATQTTLGQNSAQQNFALTADVDWGLDLRADVLIVDKIQFQKKFRLVSQSPPKHLYFKDLAHSTALIAAVQGSTQPAHGQPAAYMLSMPNCYPYADPVEYSVAWTGGATAANGTPDGPSRKVDAPAIKPVKLSLGETQSNSGKTSAADAGAACSLQAGQADCWGVPSKATALNLTWPSAGNYSLTISPARDKHGRVFDQAQATQVGVAVQ